MLLAVFSDIHSNHVALEACMAEAERRGADHWLFLGDYVSDCAYPERTMALIYKAQKEHDCTFIKGNREEYLLDHRKNGSDWRYGSTTGSLLYTYEHLTDRDLDFFDSLPITAVVNPNGKCPIRISHGSPWKSREVFKPATEKLRRMMEQVEEKVILSGHGHKPFIEFSSGKQYANTGSVGVPVSGIPKAEMLFLKSDGDSWQTEICRVPYNIEAAVREIRESGLLEAGFVWAHCMIKALREAKNYTLFCLEKAEALAEGGEVTDAHWLAAAKELGVL